MIDCTQFHPHSRHRRLCEQGLLDAPVLGKRSIAARFQRQPCVHLLPPTGELRECPTCTGKIPVPLRGCALHGVCVPDKMPPGVACCRICPDHQASAATLCRNAEPSPECAALRTSLEGRIYTCERQGMPTRSLRLLPDDRSERGRAEMEVEWDVHLAEQGPLLILASASGHVLAILKREGEGWAGESQADAGGVVRLLPREVD